MQMHRRTLVVALALTLPLAACSKTETARTYDVEEVSLAQISSDLAAGKTTSAAVTQAYIDRIKKYDPQLHSVIAIAPDALAQKPVERTRLVRRHRVTEIDCHCCLLRCRLIKKQVGVQTPPGVTAY